MRYGLDARESSGASLRWVEYLGGDMGPERPCCCGDEYQALTVMCWMSLIHPDATKSQRCGKLNSRWPGRGVPVAQGHSLSSVVSKIHE